MKVNQTDGQGEAPPQEKAAKSGRAKLVLESHIGDSIDLLVEYLADHNVTDIHTLIMGEVEKRLLIKALEKSRGNKRQAAEILGMSRNTFHRKINKLLHEGRFRISEWEV